MTGTSDSSPRALLALQIGLLIGNFLAAGLFFLIPVYLKSGEAAAVAPYLKLTGSLILLVSFVFLWPRRVWLWMPVVFYSCLALFFGAALAASAHLADSISLYGFTVLPLLALAGLAQWLRRLTPE